MSSATISSLTICIFILYTTTSRAQSPPFANLMPRRSACVIPPCDINPCQSFEAWFEAVGHRPYCVGQPNTACQVVQDCNRECYEQYVNPVTNTVIADCQLIYGFEPAPSTSSSPVTSTTTSTTTTTTTSTAPPTTSTTRLQSSSSTTTNTQPSVPVVISTQSTQTSSVSPVPSNSAASSTQSSTQQSQSVPISPAVSTASSTAQTAPGVQLWFDPLNDLTQWQVSAAEHVQIQNSRTVCTDDCVRISGYRRQDCSMTRGTSNDYVSYTLKFDVVLVSMESSDYCEVYAKFGANGVWQQLASYQGTMGTRRVREDGIQFSNTDTTANEVYIKLAANGGSRYGRDFCYYDNVYLFGNGQTSTAAKSNAVAAGKQALISMPFAREPDEKTDPRESSILGHFVAIGSTVQTLVWISLLSALCVAYSVLVWCHRQKRQANAKQQQLEMVVDSEEPNDESPLPENV